mgnify:CR=1 FL=1
MSSDDCLHLIYDIIHPALNLSSSQVDTAVADVFGSLVCIAARCARLERVQSSVCSPIAQTWKVVCSQCGKPSSVRAVSRDLSHLKVTSCLHSCRWGQTHSQTCVCWSWPVWTNCISCNEGKRSCQAEDGGEFPSSLHTPEDITRQWYGISSSDLIYG